jgi:hypothetical protein
VEVSERGLDANLAGLEALAEVLARHGAQLGIEHFGRQLAALPRLYAIRLAYLKLDGSFVAGLHENVGPPAAGEGDRGCGPRPERGGLRRAGSYRRQSGPRRPAWVGGMTGPEASRRLAG